MHTAMCDPIVRRNKPHWLNTVSLTIAALVFGSAAMVAAQGAATSPPPNLSPVIRAELLVPPYVPPPITRRVPAKVVVELDTMEKRAPLADGVEYAFWTFNGSVPGPFLRVRVSDIIRWIGSSPLCRESFTPRASWGIMDSSPSRWKNCWLSARNTSSSTVRWEH